MNFDNYLHTGMSNFKEQSLNKVVSDYLSKVTPHGDGIYGSDTAPFFGLVQEFIMPDSFRSKYDYSKFAAENVGRNIGGTGSVSPAFKSLDQMSQVIVGELAGFLLDFTNSTSAITKIREGWRSAYVPVIANTVDKSQAPVKFSEYQLPNEFANAQSLVGLLGQLNSLELANIEKDEIKKDAKATLLPLLAMVRASGNNKAYELLLKLCNLADSYFILASSVANMAKMAKVIAPNAHAGNVVSNGAVSVAGMQAIDYAPAVQPTTTSVQDLVTIVNTGVRIICDAGAAEGVGISAPFITNINNNWHAIPIPVMNFAKLLISDPNVLTSPFAIPYEIIKDPNVQNIIKLSADYTLNVGLRQPTLKLNMLILALGIHTKAADFVQFGNNLTNNQNLTFDKFYKLDVMYNTAIFSSLYLATVNNQTLQNFVSSFVGPNRTITPDMIRNYVHTIDPYAQSIQAQEVTNYLLNLDPVLSADQNALSSIVAGIMSTL